MLRRLQELPLVDAGEITFPLGPDRLRRPRQRVDWRTGKAGIDAVSGSERIRLADETRLDARNGRSPSTSTAPCLDWAAHCGMRFVCAGVGACVGGAVNAACSEADFCASRNEP